MPIREIERKQHTLVATLQSENLRHLRKKKESTSSLYPNLLILN